MFEYRGGVLWWTEVEVLHDGPLAFEVYRYDVDMEWFVRNFWYDTSWGLGWKRLPKNWCWM